MPLITIAIALAACAGQVGAPKTSVADSDRPSRSAPELTTVPPSDASVTGEVPSEIMANLVADAAERTGEDPDAIEIVQAAAVTWNDGALGCPEPGMFYTQALVDGYHVILRGGDDELDYRVTAGGGFRLCEGGGRPSG
jgi:hypothetical protein